MGGGRGGFHTSSWRAQAQKVDFVVEVEEKEEGICSVLSLDPRPRLSHACALESRLFLTSV